MTGGLRELLLGARLALSGGRGAWTRTAMTAVGVGLGVALLLLAASFPSAVATRDARTAARDDTALGGQAPARSGHSLLVADVGTTFRATDIRGRLVRAEGPRAPVAPGLDRIPAPGEVVVSPRLRGLLDGRDGALLRPRIPGRIVGTIAPRGLDGPDEAAFYAGSADLTVAGGARRIDHYGNPQRSEGLDPILAFLVVVAVVVLLVPVAVFVAAAARFGGEGRDRRLAALRLVGADRPTVRRIAAGESLVGALGGLAVGAVVFALARLVVPHVSLPNLSFFTSDVRPQPGLALLIVLAVPALAVVVTQLALTRVAIDPLGVVRRGDRRPRRVLWRVLVPVLGLALLLPLLRTDVDGGEHINAVLTSAGVVLLLVGVTAVLPWAVEAAVGRLGGGGGVAWQLAVRRLQLDDGASARVVSGIAVAVAGAIALTTLFAAVDDERTVATGADVSRAQAQVGYVDRPDRPDAGAAGRQLAAVPGVRSALARDESYLDGPGVPSDGSTLMVADCPTLRRLARITACRPGDAFVAGRDGPRAGTVVKIDGETPWRVPATARTVASRPLPAGGRTSGVLATPEVPGVGGGRTTVDVGLGSDRADALERLRNAAARITPMAVVSAVQTTKTDDDLVAIQRGLFGAAVAVLLLIAASMVVGALEDLHERRRLLSSLVAFGTPPRTLGRSILLQTAVPVALGLALAGVVGMGLGALLLRIVGQPVRFEPGPILGMVAVGAAVVPLVTALASPALRHIVRADGMRTE